MARGEPPRPGSQLPAPYRNPWNALAEALRAVAADRRLALLRLWRRNREGELSHPGFWPRDLAPLFWPLLLALVIALVLTLGSRLLSAGRSPRTEAPPPPAGQAGTIAPQATIELGAPAGEDASEPHPPEQDGPRAAAPSPADDATGNGWEETTIPGQKRPGQHRPDAADAAAADGDSSTPALRLDPLLELLSQGEDARLLLAARPDPGSATLSLTLSEAAEVLTPAALLQQAERWQQRAREAGYERLELRDAQGRLRGRGALVGSGMILLAPAPGR